MSSTPTLLRVKRRITEDPSDVLVLSAKRLKSSEDGDDNVKILKLAGTVEQADDANLTQTISRIINKRNIPNFAELKEKYKKSTKERASVGSRSKAKEKEREEERFRVVNTNRAIKIDEIEAWSETNSDRSPDSETPSIFHLYDIVKDQKPQKPKAEEEKLSCNGVEMIREYVSEKCPDDVNYVYDVYYAEEDNLADFDDSLLDGLVSIQPFNTGLEFMYDEYRDDPSLFKYEDDEDSNSEDNDRNEYPEEEDDDYEESGDYYGDYSDDLDLRMGSMRMCADEEEDLSSDDEDKLLYTQSFDEDADRHGSHYARFKQRMLKEFREEELLEDTESDDNEDNFDYF